MTARPASRHGDVERSLQLQRARRPRLRVSDLRRFLVSCVERQSGQSIGVRHGVTLGPAKHVVAGALEPGTVAHDGVRWHDAVRADGRVGDHGTGADLCASTD